jgi:hypothetical protein
MVHFWGWLQAHDLPNWFTFLFSLIVWPLVLYWWNTRKVQSVPHFEVSPQQGKTTIDGQSLDAIYFTFTNRTGSVVYLSRARLQACKKRFPIPVVAARDISRGWRELKFNKSSPGRFADDECILQTNDRVMTSIAVSQPMSQAFYSYHPGLVRRCLGLPKYFLLEYTVMVGKRKYFVQTVY